MGTQNLGNKTVKGEIDILQNFKWATVLLAEKNSMRVINKLRLYFIQYKSNGPIHYK